MEESAGTLLYKLTNKGYEVLIVHPSGDDESPWSLPKGRLDKGESPEEAARRETMEETGVIAGELDSLGFVVYRHKKKRVHGFCGEAPRDKPSCASWEIDQAQFYPLDKAQKLLHRDQSEFIPRLKKHLKV